MAVHGSRKTKIQYNEKAFSCGPIVVSIQSGPNSTDITPTIRNMKAFAAHALEMVKGSCIVCHKKCTNRCSSCGAMPYCSRGCQRDDWSRHKRECKQSKQGSFVAAIRMIDTMEKADIDDDDEKRALCWSECVIFRPSTLYTQALGVLGIDPATDNAFFVALDTDQGSYGANQCTKRDRFCDVMNGGVVLAGITSLGGSNEVFFPEMMPSC